MKTVNYGDKYTHRVTLRLSDEQYNFLINVSSTLGVSPSEYLRMSVNVGMVSSQQITDEQLKSVVMKGGNDNENVKTDINNLV